MFWRITHDFLKWIWPSAFALVATFATVALSASQLWPEAKIWTAHQFQIGLGMMFDPWFVPVAAVMFVVWLVAFFWSGHIVQKANSAPVQGAEVPERIAIRPNVPMPLPPLKDHFMNDFDNGKDAVAIQCNAKQTIQFPDASFEIEYLQQLRFGAHAKFLVFYLPACGRTVSIAHFLAENIDDYLESHDLTMGVGGVGLVETREDNLVFTRKVFIYHEDVLTLSEQGQVDNIFREHSLVLQLRSTDYVLSCEKALT